MSARNVQARPKRVPLRTCVSCRSTSAKRELVRLVCTSGGGVELDLTGKLPGRGAYLCHNPECWTRAVKGSRLENALKTKITAAAREALLHAFRERLEIEAS